LEAVTATGGIFVDNASALTIGGIGATEGVSVTDSGDIVITASSALLVSENVTAPGAITLTASETDGAALADDLTINAGVTVRSTGNTVTLRAGDDVTWTATSAVRAATNATITAGFGDLDDAGSINGAGLVTASTVDLNAATGIGNVTALNL